MSLGKRILDLNLRKMLNPNIWLLVVAVSHTLFGSLVPMLKAEVGSEDFISSSYHNSLAAKIMRIANTKKASRFVNDAC